MKHIATGRYTLITINVLLGALLLAGCSQHIQTAQYHAQSIEGIMPPLQFRLTDATGVSINEAKVRGEIALVYFGYTHCPDACPTTLTVLKQALRKLGADADAVRVLFVSVDPQRDTPKVLESYAAFFAPQISGITGTDAELTEFTKRYRVAYRRDPPDAHGEYAVYHGNAVFVFDRNGKARLLVTPSESLDDLTADLDKLIHEQA